jgi:hypothetical protein
VRSCLPFAEPSSSNSLQPRPITTAIICAEQLRTIARRFVAQDNRAGQQHRREEKKITKSHKPRSASPTVTMFGLCHASLCLPHLHHPLCQPTIHFIRIATPHTRVRSHHHHHHRLHHHHHCFYLLIAITRDSLCLLFLALTQNLLLSIEVAACSSLIVNPSERQPTPPLSTVQPVQPHHYHHLHLHHQQLRHYSRVFKYRLLVVVVLLQTMSVGCLLWC